MLASGNSADPQSFNRYAYVGNDPINATDPTGMWQENFPDMGTMFSMFSVNNLSIIQPIPYQETTTTYTRDTRTGQQKVQDTLEKIRNRPAEAGDTTIGRTITLRNPNERNIQAGFSITFKNKSLDNDIGDSKILGGVKKVISRESNAMLSLTILDTEDCAVDDCEVLKGFSYSVDGESGGIVLTEKVEENPKQE